MVVEQKLHNTAHRGTLDSSEDYAGSEGASDADVGTHAASLLASACQSGVLQETSIMGTAGLHVG